MRLGLIAMSGTRAQNPELTALGLTLPGFVERGKTIASLPSLGLLTLAGMTPPDVDVRYIEIPDLDAVPSLPEDFDVVAISSFTAQIKQAYRLADRYRAGGTRVILGGLHVTARSGEAMRHADSIVLGEGETAWPLVMQDLLANRLQARYDARGVSFDLALAPMPRFDLLDPEHYNRLTVQTQRGCPHNCEFCASSIRISPHYKLKPAEKVIAEIKRIKELWPRPFIEFADDNSFVNRQRSKRLLRALAHEDVRWFTETDISIAEDDELLERMRDSGCAQILIGLESPSPCVVDGIEQRSNWKRKHVDAYARAIDRIQSHGITVNGCFVLGLDHSGPESFDDVLRFVRDTGLYEVQITVLTAFPGTPLYRRLREQGRLIQDEAWETCTLFDVNFVPERMSVSELETGFRALAEQLYSGDETRARRRRFIERGGRHGAASGAAVARVRGDVLPHRE
jgi:radical SAM superfamily enzyme YgiQ (UPF0313 family)